MFLKGDWFTPPPDPSPHSSHAQLYAILWTWHNYSAHFYAKSKPFLNLMDIIQIIYGKPALLTARIQQSVQLLSS